MLLYREDKARVDRFEPEIKGFLGQHFFATATHEQDCREATDLVLLLRLPQLRIGCRVRRHEYYHAYKGEFTIRAGRPRGTKTEYQKIIEGWGDYLFYGFADPTDEYVHYATLINLPIFRASVALGVKPINSPSNCDNSSSFYVYRFSQFPPSLIERIWMVEERHLV